VAEPPDVFTSGLIGDADAIANLVKSEARLLGEEL
jgi:20S proteasome alpha/beta subunit